MAVESRFYCSIQKKIDSICDIKKSQQEPDLPTSVNARVILPFHKGFIFMNWRSFMKNKTHAKFSEFRVSNFNSTTETLR